MTRTTKDKLFKSMSKASKWVRNHISKKLGRAMVDFTQEMWSKSLDKEA